MFITGEVHPPLLHLDQRGCRRASRSANSAANSLTTSMFTGRGPIRSGMKCRVPLQHAGNGMRVEGVVSPASLYRQRLCFSRFHLAEVGNGSCFSSGVGLRRNVRSNKTLRIVVLVTAISAPAASVRAVPVFFAGTGHYYETIVAPGITWAAADSAAQALSHLGAQGHLATITSAGEDSFINGLRLLTPGINLSGGFERSELWVGGFQLPGSIEPGHGWQWVNLEGAIPTPQVPVPGYSNWLSGEPNNFGPENHVAVGIFNLFVWNDEGDVRGIHGYVVEFDTVPEPSTVVLVGLSLLSAAAWRRKRP